MTAGAGVVDHPRRRELLALVGRCVVCGESDDRTAAGYLECRVCAKDTKGHPTSRKIEAHMAREDAYTSSTVHSRRFGRTVGFVAHDKTKLSPADVIWYADRRLAAWAGYR